MPPCVPVLQQFGLQYMQLPVLLADLAVRALHGTAERDITSIEYDSRRCVPGSLFVAVRGTEADGHAFVADALARGATAVVHSLPVNIPGGVTAIEVEDTRRALALLSRRWYGNPAADMTVIGVTGTNGKTTTTFILRSLLEAWGEPTGLIGTTGNYIGAEVVPTNYTTPEAPELMALFARMRDAGIRTVVMEVSSHGLALDRVYGLRFAGAIFTNLTQDHLDFHASMEEYALAKKRLFDMLPSDATAVVNGDDPYGVRMLADSAAQTMLTVGRGNTCDIVIAAEEYALSSSSFELRRAGRDTLRLTIPLVGRFNVENVAACAAYFLATGRSAGEIETAAGAIRPAPGRMERIALPNGAVAVVDYAHTPDALEKALMACRELLHGGGRLLCVFGCGGDRDRTKRPVMGRLAVALADAVIVTNDNPRRESPESIVDDILSGVDDRSRCRVIPDRAEAIAWAVGQAQPGDLVLVAGKGHETWQIIGGQRLHFDDCEELRRLAGRMQSAER